MPALRAVALTAVVGAVAATDANAQSPIIGFRVGASLAKPDVEVQIFEEFDFDPNTLTRFVGGGFIRFPLGLIGIQPELMYVTKGAAVDEQFTVNGETATVDGSLNIDYIEVPVLLHLQLGTGAILPHLVAGPAFAFEINCTTKVTIDAGSLGEDTEEQDCEDENRKKLDVGAMFGAGLAFPAGPGSVLLDGRYNIGLINLVDRDTEESFKHRVFYITAGYEIPLGIR